MNILLTHLRQARLTDGQGYGGQAGAIFFTQET